MTVSVSYPVAPAEQDEFEAWSRLRLAESAERPGHLGGQVLAPPQPGPDWYIVHRFENERAASSWEDWFRASPGFGPAGGIEWRVDRAADAARARSGRPVGPGEAPAQPAGRGGPGVVAPSGGPRRAVPRPPDAGPGDA
ncbi:MAG TPA: antibiotic biosynthesis monooxygenase, partial [Pseudonocardia sp.]|nr:antibiotic biosynthesis monooxygenase [Pseudonocardia sp.]